MRVVEVILFVYEKVWFWRVYVCVCVYVCMDRLFGLLSCSNWTYSVPKSYGSNRVRKKVMTSNARESNRVKQQESNARESLSQHQETNTLQSTQSRSQSGRTSGAGCVTSTLLLRVKYAPALLYCK